MVGCVGFLLSDQSNPRATTLRCFHSAVSMLWVWTSARRASTRRSGARIPASPTDFRWIESREVKAGDGTRDVVLADFFKWSAEVKGEWDVILDYT